MKADVLHWTTGRSGAKRVSKETLNHRGLIELVSGLDVYTHTPEAYRRAYEALGIDLVYRVPLENAPPPTPPGGRRTHPGNADYDLAALGVYDTASRRVWPCLSLGTSRRGPDYSRRNVTAGREAHSLTLVVTPLHRSPASVAMT